LAKCNIIVSLCITQNVYSQIKYSMLNEQNTQLYIYLCDNKPKFKKNEEYTIIKY